MIFSTGSTFIFGSWISKADDKDKLQGRLLEDHEKSSDHGSILMTSESPMSLAADMDLGGSV
jgi:hypothetical protein